MWNGSCSLMSRSLMARSDSRTRFVHAAFSGFCMLYWSPRSSNFCSSPVNCMLVRLTVREYSVGCFPWGWCAGVFCFSRSVYSSLFSLSQ